MAVKGLRDLQKKARRMKSDLQDEIDQTVQDNLSATRREAQSQIMVGNTIHTGELLTSWRTSQVDIGRVTRHRLVNFSPYSGYVEYGTGARFGISPFAILPPRPRHYRAPSHTPRLTAAIRRWVMTKPGFIGSRSGAVAYQIADTISVLGTNAHPFLRPAWFTQSGGLPGIRANSPFGIDLRKTVKTVVRRS